MMLLTAAIASIRWQSCGGILLIEMVPASRTMDSADGDNVYEVTVTAFDGSGQQVRRTLSHHGDEQRRVREDVTLTQRRAAGKG